MTDEKKPSGGISRGFILPMPGSDDPIVSYDPDAGGPPGVVKPPKPEEPKDSGPAKKTS